MTWGAPWCPECGSRDHDAAIEPLFAALMWSLTTVLDGWEPRWESRATSSSLRPKDRVNRVSLLKLQCCYLGWVVQASLRACHKARCIL
jgi:hypothetical protein